METVLRGLAIYFFLLAMMRIGGKRTFAEMTTFDFVLLLVIAETVQQSLTGEDNSIITALILITTLIGVDIALSLLKQRSKRIEELLDGVPVILVENGQPLRRALERERVDEGDILEAARRLRGLERMDQIKFAVLERDGGITVIARERP